MGAYPSYATFAAKPISTERSGRFIDMESLGVVSSMLCTSAMLGRSYWVGPLRARSRVANRANKCYVNRAFQHFFSERNKNTYRPGSDELGTCLMTWHMSFIAVVDTVCSILVCWASPVAKLSSSSVLTTGSTCDVAGMLCTSSICISTTVFGAFQSVGTNSFMSTGQNTGFDLRYSRT